MQDILPFIKSQLERYIREGGRVLDGTAGRGQDTLFLARRVGSQGKVYAFDIQAEALAATAALLNEHGLTERVQLIHDSHANLADHLAPESLDAAVFNFGYLPGGDKRITTQTASSIQAINAALNCLRPQSLLAAALYPGHEAGREETAALLAHAAALPPQSFDVMRYEWLNRRNHPPVALLILKR